MSFTRVKPDNYPVGGDVTSTEMNQLDIDHANALDKVGGDTITGPVVVSGTTISLVDTSTISVAENSVLEVEDGTLHCTSAAIANIECAASFGSTIGVTGLATCAGGLTIGIHNVAFTSRSVTRVQIGEVFSDEWDAATGPAYAPNSTAQGTPADYPLVFELKIPHGAVLNSVTVRLDGHGLHSFAPATLPTLTVSSLDGSGNQVTLGSVATDSSATPGGSPTGYDVPHSITVSGLTTSIDRTTKRYVASLSTEAGTHAAIGSPAVYTCSATWTQSSYEED